MNQTTTAARAIVHQRDFFAENGRYDLTTFNPCAEKDQEFDDWTADILQTAMAYAATQHVITVTPEQHSTILAALRYYQSQGMGDPANRPADIHTIATNDDEVTSLDDAGIDELCESIN